jgi:hypothetical protein
MPVNDLTFETLRVTGLHGIVIGPAGMSRHRTFGKISKH